jgi:predicted transcriptional regulator
MKISEAAEALNAKVLCGDVETEVLTACGADLMSDVLAFSKEQGVLLTGLVNPQVVRTAEMMDVSAIIFVRGKTPSDEVIELADDGGIVVLATDRPMYEACGILYSKGLPGGIRKGAL